MAGTIRAQYPASIRPVLVLCTARISKDMIMRAFSNGADGVVIGGCHIGECDFENGNVYANKLVAYLKRVMVSIGMNPNRLKMFFTSAAEGERFKNEMTRFDQKIRELGPNPTRNVRHTLLQETAKKEAAKQARLAKRASQK